MEWKYKGETGHTVIFEADDINDKDWEPIVKCLMANGFKIFWADGNVMNIQLPDNK